MKGKKKKKSKKEKTKKEDGNFDPFLASFH